MRDDLCRANEYESNIDAVRVLVFVLVDDNENVCVCVCVCNMSFEFFLLVYAMNCQQDEQHADVDARCSVDIVSFDDKKTNTVMNVNRTLDIR
jgi:hypothetical protein